MDVNGLHALLQAPPGSYDLSILKPLKEQLKQAQANADLAGDDDASQTIGVATQAIEALEREQTKRLDAFASEMLEEFEKAVKSKRDVELRWIDDERQYNGERRIRDSKAYPNDAGDKWFRGDAERPTLHATRSRTLRYGARFIDMMIPGNEVPIKVDPASNPDPSSFPGFNPQAASLLDYASDAAGRMNACVKEQLFDQKIQDIGRGLIFDACKLGCGLMKGPFVEYRKKKKPQGPQSIIVLDKRPVPGAAYVDPWMFYYDMARTLEESSRTFEVHLLDKRAVNDLKFYPNMIKANIDLLLKEKDPSMPTNLSAAITMRNRMLNSVEPIKDRWAVVEMHGIVDVDVLENAMGIHWEHEDQLPLIEFWFCNGRALKWKLSPLECDWRVPYYNFTPFPCDDSIFGYGVPYMANGGQKIVDGALDATLANASASSGPFMFFKKGNVTPMDEEWRVRGLKTFSVLDPTDAPVENSFASVLVTSNVQGNLDLLNQGLEFMDQDILIDQVMQGNMSAEDMPASGLLQVINIQNIFQRMIAARADDSWFKPMGERWVQWNLQFNPDPSIKGDFDVKGVASTTLVSKDLQIQHTQVGMQLASQPQFAGMSDQYEWFSSFVRMLDIPNRDQIMFDKNKATQNQAAMQKQNQGGDPMVAVKMAQIDVQKAELQLKTQEVEYAHQERMSEIARQQAKDQADAVGNRQDQVTRVIVAQTQKETALINVAAQKDINVSKLAAIVQKASMDNATKRFIAANEIADSVNHEKNENVRQVAKMVHETHLQDRSAGVQTLHKAADLHVKNVHKAVDVQTEAAHHAADIIHEKQQTAQQQQHESDQADKAQVAANSNVDGEGTEDQDGTE